MNSDRITAILYLHKKNIKIDVDLPLDITVNELIIGLNEGFQLGINTGDLSKCFLKTENPIALLKGNKSIAEYGMRNGTTINITE
ncbi:EsaB/YukD family protein [Anaerocolumna sp. AGMB13020]|uniref:EsaB/YukD family protein n=1 Tax=Anaerocolumna sp. AGMB13020 TaxID=3081750 RepID=UPI00295499F7|nr:EsaB/YukD family protein [Anaerocolumna sp. AGMB13020]WOO37835.1 EsaB/YukD family protein [Anaerocolumna sp. AGMB13020]